MIKFWLSYDNLKIVAKFMKMRNHDHIKGEKGENLIISQDKKLHNSAKSWSFFKKLGSFELLMVWAARNWSYMLNLTHSRPFYEQITLCASYYIRICINHLDQCNESKTSSRVLFEAKRIITTIYYTLKTVYVLWTRTKEYKFS